MTKMAKIYFFYHLPFFEITKKDINTNINLKIYMNIYSSFLCIYFSDILVKWPMAINNQSHNIKNQVSPHEMD